MVSLITEAMMEGGLYTFLGRRLMEKKMDVMQDHFIVCGFGRIGKVISKILHENNRPFLIIENNPEEIKAIEELGYLVLHGDSTNDDMLTKAHIKDAKALIAVTSSDADNVYIILSARGLKSDIYILARSSGKNGAQIDFIDLTVHEGELGLRLEELQVSDTATFVNKTLMDSGIRSEHDLIVVAIKRQKGEMLFNPSPGTEILAGDILVVLGEHLNIQDLEKKL